uniref:Uncharacterized protein n=1 Tax=Arundo donax TaxID=35708 RepID=A0A0A8YG36_ARUDO
MGFSLFDILRY